MKRIITVLGLVVSAAVLALGIGSPLAVDSTQPLPPLTRIEAWQGQRITIIPTIRQGGTLYTNAATVRMIYGSNLLALAFGSVSGVLTNGTTTLTTDVIGITGRCVYVVSIAEGAITNVLGTGVLNVTPTTSQGVWPTLPGVTFPELDPVFLAWTNAGFPGVSITGSGGPSYPETTNIAEAAVAGYSNCVSNAVALAKTALQSEADTLQTVITRGSTASGSISVGTEDGDNIRLGYSAGSSGATGNNNFYAAVGGYGAVGSYNFWGTFAGWTVRGGDYNSGIGFLAGQYSSASSVSYFGAYSGTSNNLSNAVFIDAYATDPCASGTSFTRPATNDSIVIDGNAAQMYLGRPDGSVQLRGNITGITAAQVGAVPTNRTITINGSVGTLDSNLVLTVEGGGGSGTSTGDAYRVIQADTGAYVFVENTNAWLVSDGGVTIITNQAYIVVTNLIVVAGGTYSYRATEPGTVYTTNGIYGGQRKWRWYDEVYGTFANVYTNGSKSSVAYTFQDVDNGEEPIGYFTNRTLGFASAAGTYARQDSDFTPEDTFILAELITTNLFQTTTNVLSYTNLLCTAPFASNIVNSAISNITAAQVGAVDTNTHVTSTNALWMAVGAAATNMYETIVQSNNAAVVVSTNLSQAQVNAHTNNTSNPHGVTPAQIGAISNTPQGIANALIMTNNSFKINGTAVAIGADVEVTGSGISAATATNIARLVSAATVFSLTGTVAITTNRFWEIPLPVQTNCIVDMARIRLFLASTNEGNIARTLSLAILRTPNDRCNDVEFDHTNLSFYACTTTVAEAGGVYSNVVIDASVFSVRDRICKPLIGWPDLQTVTSKTATVVGYRCTNTTTEAIGTLISKANEISVFSYIPPANTTNLIMFGGWNTPATNVLGYEIPLGTARYY